MKKAIAIFTIVSFLIDITSCFSYKTLTSQEEYSKYSGNKRVHVLYIKTKQYNVIEFNKHYPGKISETCVVGLPQLRLQVGEMDSIHFYGERDSVIIDENKFKSIWKNGVDYEVIKQNKLDFICHASDTIQIPLSDIKQLRFKKINAAKTIGLVVGIPAVIIVGMWLIVIISLNNIGINMGR